MKPIASNEYVIVDIDNPFSNKHISCTFTNPVEIIKADKPDEIYSAIDKIDLYANQGKYLCGYFSYEASCFLQGFSTFETADKADLPLIWFGVFEKPGVQNDETALSEYYLSELQTGKNLEPYAEGFKKIKKYIEEGLVYQINYTFPIHFSFYGDSVALFYDLKESQKSSYNFMFSFNDKKILSLSPELFFYKNKHKIFTRPMKGTIPRDPDPEMDLLNKEKLQNSLKNRAENAMITDILRNDLGMICEHGSVNVDKYLAIEEYPTLYQMTSTVSGVLKSDTSYKKIFQSLFPIASITGAPKYEAMKKISEIEHYKRGIYTGAIGLIEPNGEAIFNVAIRTVELNRENGRICVGSAVVFDSNEKDEYNESLLKSSFITLKRTLKKNDFYLFETMVFNGKRFVLLNLHLDRLKKSSLFFNFKYPEDEIIGALDQLKKYVFSENMFIRVKLILYPDGVLKFEHKPYEHVSRNKRKPYRIVISKVPVKSNHVFNYHKTSLRARQDDELNQAIKLGYDEVLFINEENKITECCAHNIVLQKNGKWYTPELTSGLLPGTFRQYLLNKKYMVEKALTFEDIKKADQIYLINSVRGFNKAEIVDIDFKKFI